MAAPALLPLLCLLSATASRGPASGAAAPALRSSARCAACSPSRRRCADGPRQRLQRIEMREVGRPEKTGSHSQGGATAIRLQGVGEEAPKASVRFTFCWAAAAASEPALKRSLLLPAGQGRLTYWGELRAVCDPDDRLEVEQQLCQGLRGRAGTGRWAVNCGCLGA